MGKILCSTGALLGRPNGRNFNLLPSLENQLHCDGLELMFYDSWYDQQDALFSVLSKLRKPIFVFHAEKSICSRLCSTDPAEAKAALCQFAFNCAFAAALHIDTMVFHLWDGWMDDGQIHAALAHYNTLKSFAQEHHILLTIENIVTRQYDPLHYCRMLLQQDPEALFTYDTKMAAFHQQEKELYGKENTSLAASIAHLHINDYAGGYMDWTQFKTRHIGDGHAELEPLFPFLRSMGYSGFYTTEATSFDQTGAIDLIKLNHTLTLLKNLAQQE